MITADVGGTSFDTCLIPTAGRRCCTRARSSACRCRRRGSTCARSAPAAARSPTSTGRPAARRPAAAPAPIPGPACYGRGGTEPTVTDAAFAARHARRRRARRRHPARCATPRARASRRSREQLGFEVDDVARGILTIAAANMANAIREITVEQGLDPRDVALMPFGGAGPLFATLLAGELEITQIVVPPLRRQLLRLGPARRRPDADDGADAHHADSTTNTAVGRERAARRRSSPTVSRRAAARERTARRCARCALDLRYVGQEHTLTIAVAADDGPIAVRRRRRFARAFTDEYERTFGHAMDEAVEIVSVRATLRTPLPRARRRRRLSYAAASHDGTGAEHGRGVLVRDGRLARLRARAARDRSARRRLSGPAIVAEETATTYLDARLRQRACTSPARCSSTTRRRRDARRQPRPITYRAGAGARDRRRRRRSDHDRGRPPRPQLGRRTR